MLKWQSWICFRMPEKLKGAFFAIICMAWIYFSFGLIEICFDRSENNRPFVRDSNFLAIFNFLWPKLNPNYHATSDICRIFHSDTHTGWWLWFWDHILYGEIFSFFYCGNAQNSSRTETREELWHKHMQYNSWDLMLTAACRMSL